MNLNQGTLKAFSQNKIGIFNPDFNGNSSHFLVLVRYLALLPGALAFFFSNSKEIQQLCYVLFPWVLGEGPMAFWKMILNAHCCSRGGDFSLPVNLQLEPPFLKKGFVNGHRKPRAFSSHRDVSPLNIQPQWGVDPFCKTCSCCCQCVFNEVPVKSHSLLLLITDSLFS